MEHWGRPHTERVLEGSASLERLAGLLRSEDDNLTYDLLTVTGCVELTRRSLAVLPGQT